MAKSTKTNSKTEINTSLLVLGAIIWFLVVSFITAHTEYSRLVADRLADPQGVSTQLESILSVLIVVITFLPSGLAFAYPYIKKNFVSYKLLRTIVLSLGIAVALYVPFSWYNFSVNFGS